MRLEHYVVLIAFAASVSVGTIATGMNGMSAGPSGSAPAIGVHPGRVTPMKTDQQLRATIGQLPHSSAQQSGVVAQQVNTGGLGVGMPAAEGQAGVDSDMAAVNGGATPHGENSDVFQYGLINNGLSQGVTTSTNHHDLTSGGWPQQTGGGGGVGQENYQPSIQRGQPGMEGLSEHDAMAEEGDKMALLVQAQGVEEKVSAALHDPIHK